MAHVHTLHMFQPAHTLKCPCTPHATPTVPLHPHTMHPHATPTVPLHQVKDPNAPKKPSGPYMFYCKDKRPALKEKHPAWKITEMATELGAMWKKVDEAGKKKYYAEVRRGGVGGAVDTACACMLYAACIWSQEVGSVTADDRGSGCMYVAALCRTCTKGAQLAG